MEGQTPRFRPGEGPTWCSLWEAGSALSSFPWAQPVPVPVTGRHASLAFLATKWSSGCSGRYPFRNISSLIIKPVSVSIAHYLLNCEDQRKG